MKQRKSEENITSQSKRKSRMICIGLMLLVAITICSSIYIVKFSHEYVCGGQRLTDNQYKDLMSQLAISDGAIPEADFVECKTFVNAKIFRIQYIDQSRMVLYSVTADTSYAKYDGSIWAISGGSIAEIIHAKLDKGQFKVTKIVTPIGDGADYIKGIRELFPTNVANIIIHDGGEAVLFKKNQNQAEKYFGAEVSEKGYLDVNFDNGKVTVVDP